MLTSYCICKNYHLASFKKVLEFKNETVFKDYEGIIIGKCLNCGVLKTLPLKTNIFNPQQSRANFYENNQDLFLEIFQPIVKRIKKIKDKGTVLDVGCSSGLFLELLKRNGFEVYGIEPNKEAFRLVHRKFKGRVFNGVLKDYVRRNKNKFDVIIYNHVLEHIENPIEELRLAKSILKKDGIIVFGLPNTRNSIFFLRNKYWEPLMPGEHVWHFSDRYFLNFLEKQRFKTLEISYSDDERRDYPQGKRVYFSFLSLLNKVFQTGEAMLIIACAGGQSRTDI